MAVGCAHAHPELEVAARAVGGGEQPVAAKTASSLSVPDRTGPGRMGAVEADSIVISAPTSRLTTRPRDGHHSNPNRFHDHLRRPPYAPSADDERKAKSAKRAETPLTVRA